jgi:hypothetical protein
MNFFFLNLFTIFFEREEHYFWMNHNSQIKTFSAHPKITNLFSNNVNFDFLTYYDMEIRLDGSDLSFLT